MSMVEKLKPGQVLEVLGAYPLTLKDFPRILENSDHELIKVDEEAGFFRLSLPRGHRVRVGVRDIM
jgi:TusA-related sulfurtransferase